MKKNIKKFKIFDSDALNNFHKRIFFSIIVFISFYFLAIYRIADVMIFDLKIDTKKNIVNFIPRGKIYDRNGNLLSTNIKSYSLHTNPKKLKIMKKFQKNYQIF